MSRFLWTQKEDIGPSARFGHAMTYDSVRSRTVLFGGSSLIGGQVGSANDTWEWDGEFWTQMADIGPRCFLVGSRQLASSTTPGSGTAWPGPNSKTQVHRLDGITRWPSTWCTTS